MLKNNDERLNNMGKLDEVSKLKEGISYIRSVTDLVPDIALILGSGLGDLAEEIQNPVIIKYSDIPCFMTSDVEGHKNQLVIGNMCGKCVLAMQGRFHYYEGYSQADITNPVRLFKMMGIDRLLVTNAAGGVNKAYKRSEEHTSELQSRQYLVCRLL